MKPGIYNMSNRAYHTTDALSKSDLDLFAKSPAHYKKKEKTTTDAMIFGSAFHTYVLEKDLFEPAYRITEGTKTSKLKAQAEADGVELLSLTELETIKAMADSINSHTIASKLLEDGESEQSIFWDHPVYNFGCKCRPDKLNDNLKLIIDLKSTQDADLDSISKSIANYNYHRQDYHYTTGVNTILTDEYQFIFIFVEKKQPYGVNVVTLDYHAKEAAKAEVEELYSRFNDCLEADSWPSYEPIVSVISLPVWKTKSIFNGGI